jgi:cell division protein FtsL
MTRLNLVLFVVLIMIALGTVTAQHKSRKLYFELQQQQDIAKQYAIEWGQLQLEQSTWAMHARIEHIAAKQLQMQVPDVKRIQVVSPESSQSTTQQSTEQRSTEQPKIPPLADPQSNSAGKSVP